MTFCLYGRMSLDSGTRMGEWYFLKGGLTPSEADDKVTHYKKTWRYVDKREEKKK